MSGGLNTELSRTVGMSRNDTSLSDFEALTTNRKHNKGTLVFSKIQGAYDTVYVLKCAQNHRLVNFGGVSAEQIRQVTDSFKNAVAKELDTIVDKVRKANLGGFSEEAMTAKVKSLKRSFDKLIDNKNGGSYEFRPLRREEIAAFIVQVKTLTRDMTPEKLLLRSAAHLMDVVKQVHLEKNVAAHRNTAQAVVIDGGAYASATDATISNFRELTTDRSQNRGVLRFDLSKGKLILECAQKSTIFNRMEMEDAELVHKAFENAVNRELDTLAFKAQHFGLPADIAKRKVERFKAKFGQMISIKDVNAPGGWKPLERKEIGKIVEMVLNLTRKMSVDEALSSSANDIRMPEEVAVRFRRAGEDEPVVKNEFCRYNTVQEIRIDGDEPETAQFSDFAGLTTRRVHNKGTLVFSRGITGKLVLKCAQHHNSLANIGRVSEEEAREVCEAFKNAVNQELESRFKTRWYSAPSPKPDWGAMSSKLSALQYLFEKMIKIRDDPASDEWKPMERMEIGRIVELVRTIRGKLSVDQLLTLDAEKIIDEAKRIMQEDPMPAEVADDVSFKDEWRKQLEGLGDFEDLNLADLEDENIPASGTVEKPESDASEPEVERFVFTPESCSERGVQILGGADFAELAADEKAYLQGCLTVDRNGFAKFLNSAANPAKLSEYEQDGIIANAMWKYLDAYRQLKGDKPGESSVLHLPAPVANLKKDAIRLNRVWTQDPAKKTGFMLSILNGLQQTNAGLAHLRSRFTETGFVADAKNLDIVTRRATWHKHEVAFEGEGEGYSSFERTLHRAYRLSMSDTEMHKLGTQGSVVEFAGVLGLRSSGTLLLEDGADGDFKANHVAVMVRNNLRKGHFGVLSSGEGEDRRFRTIAGVYTGNDGKAMFRLIDSADGTSTDVPVRALIGAGKNRIDLFEVPPPKRDSDNRTATLATQFAELVKDYIKDRDLGEAGRFIQAYVTEAPDDFYARYSNPTHGEDFANLEQGARKQRVEIVMPLVKLQFAVLKRIGVNRPHPQYSLSSNQGPSGVADVTLNRIWKQGTNTCFMMSVLNGLAQTERGVKYLKGRFADGGFTVNVTRNRNGNRVREDEVRPFQPAKNGHSAFVQTLHRAYRDSLREEGLGVTNIGEQGFATSFAQVLGLKVDGSEVLATTPRTRFGAELVAINVQEALSDGKVCVLFTGSAVGGHFQAVSGVYTAPDGEPMIRLIDSIDGSVHDRPVLDFIGVGMNHIDTFEIPR